ncbi:MAG: hypothetical protein LQ342_000462 [Letrouitia transgressa]|nr:MAG: hypothetical protein LQ342_000462 [Letrouitia transgressa]
MVATRNLQLTVKKTARQQKTLEGQLMMIKDGERTAISSRVAELDQIMPQYLGVSKAVLDSVIFCHQDESLWPMSEPSVLKKRFDEIFEAMKYTKAIDNIKQLRKKQNEELEKYRIMEKHCKEDKDRADRAQKRSSELSDGIEELRAEQEELEKKAKEAKEKAQEAWTRGATFEHAVESLKFNKQKKEWLEKQLNDIARDLKQRPESDEWLQDELDQYEQRVAVHEEHKQQKTERYNQLQRSIEHVRNQLQSKHAEAGKYEQQKASYEQEVQRRQLLAKESAKRHNIRGFETDLDSAQIDELMQRISNLLKDQNANMERVRQEFEKELQQTQDVLSKLGERRSGLQEAKNSSKQQSAANDQKLGTLQKELNGIDTDEGQRALIKSNVKELEAQLHKSRDDLYSASWDRKIQDANTRLRSVEDDKEQTSRDLVQRTKQSEDLARLDHLKKELADRKRGLDTLKGAHKDRLATVVGHNWLPASVETDFQVILEQRTRNLKELEHQQQVTSRELEQIEFQLGSMKSDLKKKQSELEACARVVTEATGHTPDRYIKDLEESQSDRDNLRADVDDYAITRKLYRKSIKTAQGKGKCELCDRHFEDNTQRSQFMRKMEEKIEENALKEYESQLEHAEEDLRKVRLAGSSHNIWSRLTLVEVPKLTSEIKALEGTRATILRRAEDKDKAVLDHQEAKRDAEALTKPVSSITKFQTEINNFTAQIENLSAKHSNNGLSRTVEDINEQIESLNGRSREIRANISKMSTEKERAQTHLNSQELDLSNLKNELVSASHQLEKKSTISRQVEEFKMANRENRTLTLQLDSQIQELAPQVSEELAKLDDIKQRGSQKEKDLQKEASQLSESVHQLNLAEQNIQQYLENGNPSRLARCKREIENLRQDIEEKEAEQKGAVVEINRISEEMRNHQETKRTIGENIKFRRNQRELNSVNTEIAELSAKNAEADLQHHKKQHEHWQKQYDVHSTLRTSKLATMKAKDDQLQQLLRDWETDYKDAARKYKEAHIKLETTKAAVEDLGRYGGALDKAIMKYHSLKMEEINRIAEELWKRTYQGTDVDSILIRSDNETAKGNRSYNYRLCMVKQDAEMDMRGRCSAGQKVLASIIIRLALAECFGVNCGLIALDEPTTNLDRDNIRSLAESLHDIIRARQQQSNFQLIVITHDEDFLKYMKCGDFCDTYYRISRSDRQKSIIERQSIAEVI